eukprot:CAMPEP_0172486084 /NCGR_PEP_ID=MMETSP1066-20121228/14474_1 /TAXON_ID=671091 /ORGANISM="Coscinodiscus wailesii, Strain CCMP2513" /LENGTH=85 /DNA_ID=CAMNT_0013251797 /DNA_START=51 /DNA_END=305 /DNA_ORIENTATION=-
MHDDVAYDDDADDSGNFLFNANDDDFHDDMEGVIALDDAQTLETLSHVRNDGGAAAFDQSDIGTSRRNGLTALLLLYILKALELV